MTVVDEKPDLAPPPFAGAMTALSEQQKIKYLELGHAYGIPADDPLWLVVMGLDGVENIKGDMQTILDATFASNLDHTTKRVKALGRHLEAKMVTGSQGIDPAQLEEIKLQIAQVATKVSKSQRTQIDLPPTLYLGLAGAIGVAIALIPAIFWVVPTQTASNRIAIEQEVAENVRWAISSEGRKARRIVDLNGQFLNKCEAEAKKAGVKLTSGGKEVNDRPVCILLTG
jgi:hypothetical protein